MSTKNNESSYKYNRGHKLISFFGYQDRSSELLLMFKAKTCRISQAH